MSQKKDILLIGGGVIGLCSAYYLLQEGHRVRILDQSDMTGGCSYGNAGMIVPSHFTPLAAPGMISKGIGWMFQPESPFYIHPRADLSLLSWGLKFYKASRQGRVDKAMPALRDLSLLSRRLYTEISQPGIFDFSFKAKGLMMLCKTETVAEEEARTAATGNRLGIEARVLNREEIRRMEPNFQPDVISAVYYPGDAHCNPGQFMQGLKSEVVSQGGEFFPNTRVNGFRTRGRTITGLDTSGGILQAGEIILCNGSESGKLGRPLGLHLFLQAGKGYSMTLEEGGSKLNYPTILCDARVTLTPMADQLRIGGTMEIGRPDQQIDPRRVRGILKAIPQYYPGFNLSKDISTRVWSGLRPCSPDGLPYLGRTGKYDNLIIATGHAMMGLSLGPATGKIVSDLVEGRKPEISLDLFSPDRYH